VLVKMSKRFLVGRTSRKTAAVEGAIETALEPGRFISYKAGWPFVSGLEAVAARIEKLARTSPGRAVTLYEVFLAGCYQKAEELDDSDGNFGMFVRGLLCCWVRARRASGASPDETAQRLISWMEDDPYGFCYEVEREAVKVLDKEGLAAFERAARERFEGAATSPMQVKLAQASGNTRVGRGQTSCARFWPRSRMLRATSSSAKRPSSRRKTAWSSPNFSRQRSPPMRLPGSSGAWHCAPGGYPHSLSTTWPGASASY
jgi:hypothetical protein